MRDRPTPRTRLRRPALLTLLAALPALCLVMFTGNSAQAHGAAMDPGSRTYLCWKYSLDQTGAVNPDNPACQAALNQGGSTAFYNWFSVLQSNGQGRMEGFIPDGQLCSGGSGAYDFSGFDLPRNDWPYTHLTAGATIEVNFSNWAHHPGEFRMYITQDGYDPTQPLGWDDLEAQPFDSVVDPPSIGSPGTDDGHYYWDATLPSGKSGKHLIYWVWERSDSPETFYGCSDVVFDGGNGEVTVPGDDGGTDESGTDESGTDESGTDESGTDESGTDESGTDESGTDESGSDESGVGPECEAEHSTVNSWGGGFQGEVEITNTSTETIGGWTTTWMQPSGNDIQSLWNGSLVEHDDHIEVSNVDWNGSLAPGASATFGYTSNGTAPSVDTNFTCGVV